MPNPSSASALPSSRHFLTSIFNSLPQTATAPDPALPTTATSNPLKALGAAHRSLLVTLHVLFPSLLLPALDLLDRGLVTKAVQAAPGAPSAAPADPPGSNAGERRGGPQEDEGENTIYVVRSAQAATHPRAAASAASRYSAALGNSSYVVRLAAWNCSCAAFAFSAFPASASGPFSPRFEEATTAGARDTRMATVDWEWEFGGLSSDGMPGHGDGVPCCKHLMACLLAERWEAVLGGYVRQMPVGREEMAGWGADAGV